MARQRERKTRKTFIRVKCPRCLAKFRATGREEDEDMPECPTCGVEVKRDVKEKNERIGWLVE